MSYSEMTKQVEEVRFDDIMRLKSLIQDQKFCLMVI